jgi:FG-GAP-like repeat
VLQGDGEGQFTNATGSPFAANGNPRGMVTGDFNGDGKPDIGVVNPFLGAVTVLLNTPAGAPSEPPIEPAPPTGKGTIPQPPSHQRGVTPRHHRAKPKARRCARMVIRIRHGRHIRTYIKKCPIRHKKATHRRKAVRSATIVARYRDFGQGDMGLDQAG